MCIRDRPEHSSERSEHSSERSERSSERSERSSERSERSRKSSRRSGENKDSRKSRGERISTKREATIGNRLRSIRNRIRNSRGFGSGVLGSKAELIMIGAGILLAIPLLHFLLWWTIGVDPLGLAKPTGRIIPFLVPSSMRAEEEPEPVKPRSRAIDPIIDRRTTPDSITRDADGKLPRPKLDPSTIHSEDF